MASGSMLALVPDTHTVPGTGATTDPHPLTPTRHPSTSGASAGNDLLYRVGNGYWAWLDHVWPAAGCTRPVRLTGQLHTVDPATGQVLASRSTETMPDGVLYKACGNRRATVCPSCAEVYRGDAYQLIRAGLVGGKGITEDVAGHPAVFATFTAPGFGPVHTRVVRRHSCKDRRRCACTPEPCHARRDHPVCPHGLPLSCTRRHAPDDPVLGEPLCLDCYDHDHQAVWNSLASELWRRTTITLTRRLRAAAGSRVRVSYAKVAEYQARGVVHFHALLRVDGIHPLDRDRVVPPPPAVTVELLEDAVRHATAATAFTSPPHPERPEGWRIVWGREVDVRPVRLAGDGSVTDAMVAAYLAKYATKSTETTGHVSRRLTPDTIGKHADPEGGHVPRLLAACWRLGQADGWDRLQRWAHMLGFGGHFLTKARRYSITFKLLRAARITWRRNHHPDTDAEVRAVESAGEDTTLVVGDLVYAGTGWHTTSDALLANSAAARARARRQAGRDQLHHDEATELATTAVAA